SLICLLDHHHAAGLRRCHSMRGAFGNISVSPRSNVVLLASELHVNCTFDDIQKTLRLRRAELSARFEFCGVFREARTHGRSGVHDRSASLHARKWRSHKRVCCQQQMVVTLCASRLPESMHGAPEMPAMPPTDPGAAIRIRLLSSHHRLRQTLLDDG